MVLQLPGRTSLGRLRWVTSWTATHAGVRDGRRADRRGRVRSRRPIHPSESVASAAGPAGSRAPVLDSQHGCRGRGCIFPRIAGRPFGQSPAGTEHKPAGYFANSSDRSITSETPVRLTITIQSFSLLFLLVLPRGCWVSRAVGTTRRARRTSRGPGRVVGRLPRHPRVLSFGTPLRFRKNCSPRGKVKSRNARRNSQRFLSDASGARRRSAERRGLRKRHRPVRILPQHGALARQRNNADACRSQNGDIALRGGRCFRAVQARRALGTALFTLPRSCEARSGFFRSAGTGRRRRRPRRGTPRADCSYGYPFAVQ